MTFRRPTAAWLLLLLAAPLAPAQTNWTNGNSSFSWNDPLNWSNGVPTQTALANFSNTGAGTLTLDGAASALGLSFTNTTAYTFNTGTGTNTLSVFGSGLSSTTAGAVTINPQLVLGAAQTWAFTNAGGALTVSDVNLGTFALTVGATNVAPIAVGGVISGTGTGVVLAHGGGTLTLSGANTYSGNLQINGGTVQLTGGANRLPTAGSVIFNNTAGVLALGSTTQSLATVSLTTVLAANTAAAGVVTGTGTLTLTANPFQVGPAGALTANPVHTLNLSGLAAFNYNNSTGVVRVGLASGATNSGALGQVATLTLGGNNTLTAATLAVGDVAASNDGGISTLNFGTTNALNVTTINVGSAGRADANVQFASGLTSPTITIRGLTGGTTSATTFNMGQVNTFSAPAQGVFTHTFDASAGTLDANITTLNVGFANIGAAPANRTGVSNATLTIGAGQLTATTLNLGLVASTGTGTTGVITNATTVALGGNGTLTMAGPGAVNVGTINLAANTLTATVGTGGGPRQVGGVVNLNGGILRAGVVQRGANTGVTDVAVTARINWGAGGTIETPTGTSTTTAINGIGLFLTAGTHTFSTPNAGNTIALDATSVVSGPSGITKTGPGLLTLAPPNTYTGTTTVNGGTVRLSGTGTLGATTAPLALGGGTVDLNGVNASVGPLSGSTGTVLNNAAATASVLTVTVPSLASSTYGAALADGTSVLAFTKSGAGTQTLSGALSYSGSTTVAAGTLVVTSVPSGTSQLVVNGGATFSLVNGAAAGAAVPQLTFGAGGGVAVLALELGAPGFGDTLSTGGAAFTSNTVRFDLTALTGFGAGTYGLLAATGGGLNTATYQIGSFPSGFGYTLNPSATSVQLNVFAITPTVGPIYWTGAQTTSWATVNNGSAVNFASDLGGTTPMVGTPSASNTVVFSSTAGTVGTPTTATTLDGNYTVGGLVFNNQTGGNITSVTVAPGNSASNTLTISPATASDGINVQAGAPPTITVSAPVALPAAQTWTVADLGTTLTVSGAMSGSGNLTKAGAGTLRLTDALTAQYTGGVTIGGGTLALDGTATLTPANPIGGAGALVKSGTGSVTLTGTNSYAGGTTLTGGTLGLGSASPIGSGPLVVSGGTLNNTTAGTLTLTNAQTWAGNFAKTGNTIDLGTTPVALTASPTVTVTNTFNVGGVISGTGFGLTKAGAGTLQLGGANTFDGPFTVSAGTVIVPALPNGGAASAIGQSSAAAGNLTLAGGQLTINATSTTDRAIAVTGNTRIVLPTSNSSLTLNGALSGAGGLLIGQSNTTVSQDTTVFINADNSAFTGGVTLNNGVTVINSSTALGTGTKTITVQVNTTGFVALQLAPPVGQSIVLPSTFSFTTSATVVNGGIVNVSGNNTIAGPITLTSGNGSTGFQSNSGTLTLSGGITPNTTARVVQLRGDAQGVVSGVIADGSTTNTLALSRLEGTGTWTLTGNNTYTLATTVQSGALLVNGQTGTNSGTGTGAVTVTGGTLGGLFGGNGRAAGLVTVNGGTVPGTLRPGDATAVGTLTLNGGLTVASGGRLSFRITDGSTPAAANSGGSTLGTLPNPTSNNFLNLTAGTTTLNSGLVVVLDGTGVSFTPGQSYSYRVGQGAGAQSLTVTAPGQFVFTGVLVDTASLSFVADGSGNLYVNFTPVPEPATVLAVAAGGLLLVRRRRV